MCEEARQVAQLALLESMHTLILVSKELRELFLVDLEEVAEALADVSIEWQVSAVLHATLNHHAAQLDLLPRPNLKLQKLMAALLVLHR